MKAARVLSDVIEAMDKSQPLLAQAYAILRPILDDVLAEKITSKGSLPHRKFFFGMYEDSLPAHYLHYAELMNAISDFDNAWLEIEL